MEGVLDLRPYPALLLRRGGKNPGEALVPLVKGENRGGNKQKAPGNSHHKKI